MATSGAKTNHFQTRERHLCEKLFVPIYSFSFSRIHSFILYINDFLTLFILQVKRAYFRNFKNHQKNEEKSFIACIFTNPFFAEESLADSRLKKSKISREKISFSTIFDIFMVFSAFKKVKNYRFSRLFSFFRLQVC